MTYQEMFPVPASLFKIKETGIPPSGFHSEMLVLLSKYVDKIAIFE